MSAEAVFERRGELFFPSSSATGPWGRDRLHGGPVLGLLVRALEASVSDPDWVCARMTVDMFRPAPHAPLSVRCELVRQGARLAMLQAGLFAEQTEVARANAIFLRESELDASHHTAPPPSYEGLPSESLLRGRRAETAPPGFHTRVETRWPAREAGQPMLVWFRLPMPLVAAEPTSALQRAVALTDFANAVASIAGSRRTPPDVPYINTDSTLYFSRRPEGEWFCLQDLAGESERGISVASMAIADSRGQFGRVLQARLSVRR
jgi:hypothetical protein